jgi:hypothetical protein
MHCATKVYKFDGTGVIASGLFDGLRGQARQEREELVQWLQDRSYGVDQIRNSFSPMLLPANRVLVDDGTLVSIGTPLAATVLACGCTTAQPHRQYQDVEIEGGVRRACQNLSLCQGVGHRVVESQ